MLTKCPQCCYRLTGLPEVHACPECGLEYDKRSEVFQQKRHQAVLGIVVIGGSGLVNAGTFVLQRGIRSSLSAILFVATLAAVALWTWRLFTGPRHRVVLQPTGILIVISNKPAQLVPWSDIGEARYNRLGGGVRVRDHSGNSLVGLDSDILGTKKQDMAFVDRAEAWRLSALGDAGGAQLERSSLGQDTSSSGMR